MDQTGFRRASHAETRRVLKPGGRLSCAEDRIKADDTAGIELPAASHVASAT